MDSGFESRSTFLFSIVVDGHKCLWVIRFGGHRIALVKSSVGNECCFLTEGRFPFFANRVGRPADCRCVQQRTLLYWTRRKRGTAHVVRLEFFNDSRWTFESIRCCWKVAFSEVPEQMEQNLFICVFRLIFAVFLVFWNSLVELFRVSTIFFKMRSDLIETKTFLLRFSLMLLERLVSDYIERIQERKTRRRQRNQKN